MKKRVLSTLLALALLLGLLPGTALATDPPHSHPICGAACPGHDGTHEAVEWKALTSDSDGSLYIDGVQLAPTAISDTPCYTLPNGSYYLADNVTPALKLYQSGTTVNLCLNGNTLDMGANNIDSGTLTLCDCGTGGTITGDYCGSEIGAGLIHPYLFSMYGGKVINTTEKLCPAIGIFTGTASIFAGEVISQHHSAIYVSPSGSGKGSVVLSGRPVIQGAEDQPDIDLGETWGTSAFITLAGPLTAAAPYRIKLCKSVLFTKDWNTHMSGQDFSDYFVSAVEGKFIERDESGELKFSDLAITGQPTAENHYTVTANGAPASYAWYPAADVTVTEENATPCDGSRYYGENWMGAGSSMGRDYFRINLSKGDTVVVKPRGTLGEHDEFILDSDSTRDYSDTPNEDGAYVLTAKADGEYTLSLRSMESINLMDSMITAVLPGHISGGAVTGQTTNQFTGSSSGTYLCKVSYANGTVLTSSVVAYTAPAATHSHPVCGTSCSGHTESHGNVTWTELTQEMLNSSDTLSSGSYYLTTDITVSKNIHTAQNATVNLCLNGHKLTFQCDGHSYELNVGASGEPSNNSTLNLCDCQDGGLVELTGGDYTCVNVWSNSTFNLYSGGVKSKGTGIGNTSVTNGKNSVIAVYGGSVTSSNPQYRSAISNYATATISGGKIEGANLGINNFSNNAKLTLSGSPNISGGTADIQLSTSSADTLDKAMVDATGYTGDALRVIEKSLGSSRVGKYAIKGGNGQFTLTNTCYKYVYENDGMVIREDHSWAAGWTHDATGHWHSCRSGCPITDNTQKDGYAAHTPGDWIIDTEATTQAAGSKHKECTVCNYITETETIPKLEQPDPGHSHQYGGWTSDAANHWHQCTAADCPDLNGSKTDSAAHTKTWVSTDAAQHWQTCATCGWTGEKTAHVYDNDQDANCNVCGYTRTVTPAHVHNWDTAWSKNATHHWHECTAEGCSVTDNSGKDGYAAHTWNAGVVTTPPTASAEGVRTYTCTACQATKTEAIPKEETPDQPDPPVTPDDPVDLPGGGTVTKDPDTGEVTITPPENDPSGMTATITPGNNGDVTVNPDTGKVTVPGGSTITIPDGKGGGTEVAVPGGGESVITPAGDGRLEVQVPEGSTVKKSDETATTITAGTGVVKPDGTVTFPDGGRAETTAPDGTTSKIVAKEGGIAGEVVIRPDTPQVTADHIALQEVAGVKSAGTESITVTLIVEKKAESAAAHAAEIKAAASGKTVEFLDLKLQKTVTDSNGSRTDTMETTNGKVLEIVVPYDTSRRGVTVYRYHGSSAEKLTKAEGDAKAGGTFKLNTASVIIYATKFSTYAIGYTPKDSGGGSGGGSSGSSGGSSGSSSGSSDDGGSAADKPFTGEVSECPRDKTCPIWLYTDVSVSAWYHDGVHYCVQQGLVTGTDSTHFSPRMTTSRAMIAAILWRLEGEPKAEADQPFSDVADDRWYTQAIAWAAEAGVIKGYGDGRFGPDDPITREQLASLLWRYAGSPPVSDLPLSFTDAGEASGYAGDALRWAVDQGILTGKGGGVLDPRGGAARAEAAQMLMRFCLNRK